MIVPTTATKKHQSLFLEVHLSHGQVLVLEDRTKKSSVKLILTATEIVDLAPQTTAQTKMQKSKENTCCSFHDINLKNK